MKKVDLKYQCPFNTNDFSKSEKGSFHCDSCSKNIIDFRGKDNIKAKNGDCGIFHASQVNKVHRRGHILQLGIAIPLVTLLGVSMPNTVNAQNEEKVEQTINNTITIHGILRDKDTQETLPFANVLLYFKEMQIQGATTNIDGQFTMKVDTNDFPINELKLTYAYIGYETEETKLASKNKGVILEIDQEMQPSDDIKALTGLIICTPFNTGNPFGIDTEIPDFILNIRR